MTENEQDPIEPVQVPHCWFIDDDDDDGDEQRVETQTQLDSDVIGASLEQPAAANPVPEADTMPEPDPVPDANLGNPPEPPKVPKFVPHVNTAGHKAICSTFLPILVSVLGDDDWRSKTPREQVRHACQRFMPDSGDL